MSCFVNTPWSGSYVTMQGHHGNPCCLPHTRSPTRFMRERETARSVLSPVPLYRTSPLRRRVLPADRGEGAATMFWLFGCQPECSSPAGASRGPRIGVSTWALKTHQASSSDQTAKWSSQNEILSFIELCLFRHVDHSARGGARGRHAEAARPGAASSVARTHGRSQRLTCDG